MKERLEIYENGEFNIRVVRNEQGEPLFCLKDVCEELGLQTKQVVRRLMDDVFSKHPIVDSLGRTQQATFVNEDGLYDTILESRKPEAKRFRKWVTSEVLPDIRRHGGYIVAMADEPDEVIIARALQLTHNRLQKREKEIATLRPKAEYAEEVLLSETCLTTRQIAKELGMTAQALNRLLAAHRIQFRQSGQSGQWMLYREYADKGLAQNRTFHYQDSKGKAQTQTQMVWTERGRLFIHTMVKRWQQERVPDLFTLDDNSQTINLNTHINYEEII